MPVDEIVFAVSCSATVTDEFELQVTKTGTKVRNWKTRFLKLNEEMTKMGGKTYILMRTKTGVFEKAFRHQMHIKLNGRKNKLLSHL